MALRRFPQHTPLLGLLTMLVLSGFSGTAFAAPQAGSPTVAPRIVAAVDETKMVTLAGSTHRLAVPKYDQGAVDDSMPMEHMLLQLRRSPEQEAALKQTIDELQDPHAGKYHQWLTADEMGTKFGPAQQDIETVSQWLSLHGFQVNTVHKNGLTIDVSGTAGQVREAFHAEIHKYLVNGQQHIANASDVQIPAALAPAISGFVALHNFMPKPALKKPGKNFTFPCTGCPDGFNGQVQYDEAPADLAAIYNVGPLYKAKKPITGKGQTVVVLERTDINPADVATFRKAFGLSSYAGTFTQIHPGAGCTDPKTNGDENEAALDAEWAGAVAADAAVELASCADTATTFGAFTAAQNLLDLKNPPSIMSLSYGECETNNGPGTALEGNAFVNNLWQQAAGEGVSVFVSTGDNGPAACDDANTALVATTGIAANALASTPYNVATGGTDFLDVAEGSINTYWSTTNDPVGRSAKSYIPESPWNDSCANSVLITYLGATSAAQFCNSTTGEGLLDIVAGSGAPSFVYAKPSWQKGIIGIPSDGHRDLPDVSLFASNGFWGHAILYCMSDTTQGGYACDFTQPINTFFNEAGGTSFTAPQFASIQALINQKAGAPQGNPDPILYDLARLEYGSAADPNTSQLKACNSNLGNGVASTCIFNDVTTGNITVPCYGANDCYGSTLNDYGILSRSDDKLLQAYPTKTGWDFATGLGSINVTNLVNAWP
jgi:subtilase family serine protease